VAYLSPSYCKALILAACDYSYQNGLRPNINNNWTFDKAAPWADTDAVLAHIYEYKKGKQKTDISLLGNPIKGGLPRFK
jgi:hypothetical protein